MTAFGQRVRDAREKKGWSQTQLARRVGLSKNGVSNIERGAMPKLPTRDALIRVLELGQQATPVETIADLQGLLAQNLPAVIAAEARRLASEEVAGVLARFRQLEPELAAQAVPVLEYLIGIREEVPARNRGGQAPARPQR